MLVRYPNYGQLLQFLDSGRSFFILLYILSISRLDFFTWPRLFCAYATTLLAYAISHQNDHDWPPSLFQFIELHISSLTLS